MRIYFSMVDDKPPDVSKRMWREFSRDGMNEIGLLFDREVKMKHFESGAASRYGYQKRSTKYQARKDKAVDRGSHRISPDAKNDLVHSGATRRVVRMNHQPQAFPTRVTVNMPTPAYVQMRPYKSGRPNLGEELTRPTQQEVKAYEQLYLETVEAEYNAYKQPQTTESG